MSSISDKTKFTFTVVVSLIGLSAWLTTIYFQGTANAQAITELKEKQVIVEGLSTSLSTDVAVIKAEVHEINRKVDKLEQ
jgi:hypothetical protein